MPTINLYFNNRQYNRIVVLAMRKGMDPGRWIKEVVDEKLKSEGEKDE